MKVCNRNWKKNSSLQLHSGSGWLWAVPIWPKHTLATLYWPRCTVLAKITCCELRCVISIYTSPISTIAFARQLTRNCMSLCQYHLADSITNLSSAVWLMVLSKRHGSEFDQIWHCYILFGASQRLTAIIWCWFSQYCWGCPPISPNPEKV